MGPQGIEAQWHIPASTGYGPTLVNKHYIKKINNCYSLLRLINTKTLFLHYTKKIKVFGLTFSLSISCGTNVNPKISHFSAPKISFCL